MQRMTAIAVSVVVLALFGVFFWALYGHSADCSQPACVQQRFSLQVELDRFERVAPMPLAIPTQEGEISLQSVLRSGGIDVTLQVDQANLPLADSGGKLDRADLYAFAQVWRSQQPLRGADARIYAMLAPSIVADTGDDLFGLMFDATDREGFAVAPLEVERRFLHRQPESVAVLQLRTFIHELLHALNRRHSQAAQMPDARLTIEAPTRCIAWNTDQLDWALREEPLMALSPSTIRFFQSAPAAEILPGPKHAPFLAGTPSTCRDVRATVVGSPETSRWRFAMRRLKGLLGIASARAAGNDTAQPADVELKLQALTTAYPLGYPVALRISAVNRGERTLPLIGRLTPEYEMLSIEVRKAPDAPWELVKPIAWYEPIDDERAMLPPGARTEQTVPVFFNKDHWTFAVAGDYEARARLHLGDDVADVVTRPVVIRIAQPRAPLDREALQLFSDGSGQLRNDLGRLLLLGGRVHDPQSDALIEELWRRYGATALGSAVQLTRASRLLRRPIDPRTGERPPPDIAGARELLADSCADSGVAALRRQLLDFQQDTTGTQPATIEPLDVAWEGSVPPRARPVATYSDDALTVAAETFHFCHDDSRLRGASARAARRFARELRRARADRIVVVGHADHSGTCDFNDGLALRRAETVRAVLVKAGVSPGRIEIAGLGKRRPLDFSATDAADALNRRVEILIPHDAAARLKPLRSQAAAHVLPECG